MILESYEDLDGVRGISRGESAPRGESPDADPPNRPLKQQYQECYRLVRLVQQSIATFDYKSEDELNKEFETYRYPARRAAVKTWMQSIDALFPNELADFTKLIQWRANFARRMHYR